MAGTLYVVNRTGERFVLDSNGLSFTAVTAPGEAYSTIVVKPKAKPPPPPPDPIETKGTLPPRPIDIDMSFIGGLPDDLDAHNLWLPAGAAAPGVATIKGAVTLDHLKTWARDIPDGQHQVLILERADGG
jgi:hypothetical protein